MLTDRQIVTLSLLNASIDANKFIPSVWAKYPLEAKEAFEELAVIADIFLEVTAEIPHCAEFENNEEMQAIEEKLKSNNQALQSIINSFNPPNN
ncbi:MAG TPA: hypothetical protein DDZ60_10335 [Planktothrix sp. UBA10369]|jgi:hypothetical protein|nr:hypothetical protein [Planktothrix sp. UBA10369]